MTRFSEPKGLPRQGFTLVEVLVAMAIIAITLTAVYHLQSQSIFMARSIQFHSVAPLLAQKKITEIKLNLNDAQTTTSGTFEDAFSGYSWQVAIEPVESATLETEAANLKRVDVTIALNGDEYTYDLRTYLLIADE